MELGEQRKLNEELQNQLHELLEGFTNYKIGHLRDQLGTGVKGKRDIKRELHIKDDPDHDSCRPYSPAWGKSRKVDTLASSGWEVKGESSTSQSVGHRMGTSSQSPTRKIKDSSTR